MQLDCAGSIQTFES